MSARTLGEGVLLGSYQPGSPAWFEARAGRLGASEIAAAAGLSRWQSPFSLWHLKAGLIPPQPDNREMAWGRDLETVIARRFGREHAAAGWRLSRCGLYANRDRPWQVAQPDRIVHRGHRRLAPLEVKTDRWADEWGPDGSDDVPIYYRCQAMWQLDTFGWDTCFFAVLLTGSDYRELRVDAHPGDIELLRVDAERFLASVEAGVPPPLDASDATHAAVRVLHPGIEDVRVEIGEDIAVEYTTALADADAAKTAKQLAASRVLHAMGDARRAVCNGDEVAIRVPTAGAAPPHLRPSRKATT